MTKLENELLAFLADYEHVVRNALEIHVRDMTEVAAETAAAYESMKDAPVVPRVPAEGMIDITPTPAGFQGMSKIFTESAQKSQEALDALEKLAELAEET